MKRYAIGLSVWLGLCSLPALAAAHDYWIEAEVVSSSPAADDAVVTLRMLVGAALVSEEERPMQRDRLSRLEHISASGSVDLTASVHEGALPFLSTPLVGHGGHLFAVERSFSSIELPADRFERYLRAEGLGAIVTERRRLGESGAPGRERYARCLSALVRVGTERDDVFGHDAGCRIAILPDSDPSLLRRGDRLAFRARFAEEPLAGAAVDLYVRDAEGRVHHRRARTDRRGRASVRAPATGQAVLRTVTMVRSTAPEEADWESWWASYTFWIQDPMR